MSSMTGVLSLLFALVVRSDALSCMRCMSKSSSCTGSSVTCFPGYVCGSSYTETLIGNAKTSVSIRTCMPSTECNYKGSISIKNGHIRTATSCCTTDHCTPTIPQLPPISSNPNGLVCRSCISDDSTWCDTSDTIQCTGDENRCLLQTTKITGPYSYSAATRGCATSSLCNLHIGPQNVEGLTTEVKFTCTSGGLSVHKVVLTPAIVCLLLLKFFF